MANYDWCTIYKSNIKDDLNKSDVVLIKFFHFNKL